MTAPTDNDSRPQPYKARTLRDFLAEPRNEWKPLIGDGGDGAVLLPGGSFMINGPTGTGKTNLLNRLTRHMAEGEPWLGLPVSQPLRVMYWYLENSPMAMQKRWKKVAAGMADEALDRVIITGGQTLNLLEPDDVLRFESLVNTWQPNVIIIDPLRHAHTADENDSAAVRRLTETLDGVLRVTHTSLIFAHHARKRHPFAKRDQTSDSIRGSTALAGWLSSALSIDVDPSGPDRLLCEWSKLRDAAEPLDRFRLRFVREELDFEVEVAPVNGKLTKDAIRSAVFTNGGTIRGLDLVQGFVDGARLSERTVRDRVRECVQDGDLVEFIAAGDERTRARSYALPGYEP